MKVKEHASLVTIWLPPRSNNNHPAPSHRQRCDDNALSQFTVPLGGLLLSRVLCRHGFAIIGTQLTDLLHQPEGHCNSLTSKYLAYMRVPRVPLCVSIH